jgi:hypothetical protein
MIAQSAPLDQQLEEQALDWLLINGTLNNGAASPYRQNAAFGNNRRSPRALYNGGIAAILGNSVFDAKPFSLTGQNTPKPSYSNVTGVVTFGGPLRIPHVIPLTAAEKFIRTQITAADMLAILRYSGGAVDVLQDSTDNRNRLLSILQTLIIGEREGFDESGNDASTPDAGLAFGQDDAEFNISTRIASWPPSKLRPRCWRRFSRRNRSFTLQAG